MLGDNLKLAISSLLSLAWQFFTETKIPETEISIGVLLIGLAIVPISLRFLSIMIGIPFHDYIEDTSYGKPKTKSISVSERRYLDSR